jgi:hypothetical protein
VMNQDLLAANQALLRRHELNWKSPRPNQAPAPSNGS